MDYNDISARMQRVMSSLNARFETDIEKHIHLDVKLTETSRTITRTIGNDDQPTLENKVLIILHNLASLKDHLKNCLRNKRLDPKIVESEIDNSLHLQVLVDIVNQEKHGYPLTKTNRSNKNPIISDLRQVLGLSTGNEPNSEAGFFITPDGKMNIIGNNNNIVILGLIKDDQGNILFSLEELVETCFERWNLLADTYQCY